MFSTYKGKKKKKKSYVQVEIKMELSHGHYPLVLFISHHQVIKKPGKTSLTCMSALMTREILIRENINREILIQIAVENYAKCTNRMENREVERNQGKTGKCRRNLRIRL